MPWNPIYMPKLTLQLEKWSQTCGAASLLGLNIRVAEELFSIM